MRIINIRNSSQFRVHGSRLKILLIVFFVFCAGCAKNDELQLARECEGRSQVYYQHAIERYKRLISDGKDLDLLYFELGRLYYSHGQLDEAVEKLKKSSFIQARKLLAISLYRLDNYSDALRIFNKHQIKDSEYLYYHGLTCERLNLFDQALEIYKDIKGGKFEASAGDRIIAIEKLFE